MGKIYKNQEVTIGVETGQNISGATCKLKYKKPSGATGEWSAVITDASTGSIEYETLTADLDETGTWTFWADITFDDGAWAPGEPFEETVCEPGN